MAIFRSGDMRTSETEMTRVFDQRIEDFAALQHLGDGGANLFADAQLRWEGPEDVGS